MSKTEQRIFATNRKARFEYFIEDTYEAGIALKGTEVKSIRAGKVSLKEAYITIKRGEAYVEGMHISPYKEGNIFNQDPLRVRKLLLHKRQIRKLDQQITQKGYTIVPLRLYESFGRVKIEIALAKGKKLYDKREAMAKRDSDMAMRRAKY
ncbi:MAG: SsrA-binding protein SmpB [Tissierellia bacterium]|nr:SsrA-binding protein SmpB [Tissierellia bacterium]